MSTKTPAKTEPLADMPTPAPKTPKSEKLFVAYTPTNGLDGVDDAAIFGVKLAAMEHAMDQDPVWKVVELRKGDSLKDAIAAKR